VGENTSQIEHEIVEERVELGRNLDELERRARDLANWRVHYRNHPAAFLGAAASAGVLIGMLSAGASSPRAQRTVRLTGEATPPSPRPVSFSGQRNPKVAELVGTWQRISEALLGVAISKVIDVVSEAIPGFRHQYEARPSRAGYASAAQPDSVTRMYRDEIGRDDR
jgi:hypothetical protein